MSDSVIHSAAGAAGGISVLSRPGPGSFNTMHLGLYSGLNSSLFGIAVTNGVYYYFYERTKETLLRSRSSKALSTLESMLAGLIAGSATTIISNPIWVVQTSQAVRTMEKDSGEPVVVKKLGFFETVQNILAKDGISAFWRGIGPALVLVMNPIIQYTAFEQLKNLLISRRTAKLRAAGNAAAGAAAAAALSDFDFFILGALSKLVATSFTYPYIVVKSRLQAGTANSLKYKSSLDGLLTIIKEEGVEGLYKGIGSKIIQSVLTAAILFAGQRRIFEMTKSALQPVLKT
ncbi:mitochondrial carrier domain-containing protein [Pholiota molesta]|nr:mitochondrial carrier domain-containing protein [Pholiota molesta]